MSHKIVRCVASMILALAVSFAGFSPALADPPSNDDFVNAVSISALPFSDTRDTSEAASSPDDPTTCSNNGSVWYQYTPLSDTFVIANTYGSNYDTVLSVFTGSPGAFNQVPGGCNDDYNGLQSLISFNATGGTTYYFVAGRCCGNGGSGGGNLVFFVEEILPPSNDDFANAKIITSLAYDDVIDTIAAGIEAGEPRPSCASDQWNKSVWYAFTPSDSGSLTASIPWANFAPVLAAYSGSSIDILQELGCKLGENLVFHVDAGVTYYFQSGANWNDGGQVSFSLDVTPPPNAFIYFYPGDPTVFDNIWFDAWVDDPAGVGIEKVEWDFGDGTTSTTWALSHRYTSDGDYTVNLKVTTYDGRTASATQVMHVKTHDVAITKITAPQSAKAGQAQKIIIEVKNRRYGEYVRIDLYKSIPGGFQWVGAYTQYVPVRSGNQTSTFTFNYTFTKDDASLGKVTFKAVATIVDFRDAWPADNELISSPPTKVAK